MIGYNPDLDYLHDPQQAIPLGFCERCGSEIWHQGANLCERCEEEL